MICMADNKVAPSGTIAKLMVIPGELTKLLILQSGSCFLFHYYLNVLQNLGSVPKMCSKNYQGLAKKF